MGIEKYRLDTERLQQYLNAGYTINFVVDFTTLLRSEASHAFEQLSAVLGAKGSWYVIPKFKEQINMLLEDDDNPKEIFFNTDKMLDSLGKAWDAYNKLPIRKGDDFSSAQELLQFFSEVKYNSLNCLITGNETEAWRHIFNGSKGNILLVTDEDIFYFDESCFSVLAEYNEIASDSTVNLIVDDEIDRCILLNGEIIKFEEILNDTGAEGVLYTACHGKKVVKIFHEGTSAEKLLKIIELTEFGDKKENFAWPEELVWPEGVVWSGPIDQKIPIGYCMHRMKYEFPMEEIYTLEIDGQPITDHVRWKIAASLLAQVLFLYIHGIQVGDYNPKNFGVTRNCDVVLMDMDSYILGRYGTEVKGRQPIPFIPDYSKKSDMIKMDYIYLISTVFCIITDGYWPYFFNEDIDQGEYRFVEDDTITAEYQQTLDAMPGDLKRYFSETLQDQRISDPFELYFLLLENEPNFHQRQQDLGGGPEPEEERFDIEANKETLFKRFLGNIKKIFDN